MSLHELGEWLQLRRKDAFQFHRMAMQPLAALVHQKRPHLTQAQWCQALNLVMRYPAGKHLLDRLYQNTLVNLRHVNTTKPGRDWLLITRLEHTTGTYEELWPRAMMTDPVRIRQLLPLPTFLQAPTFASVLGFLWQTFQRRNSPNPLFKAAITIARRPLVVQDALLQEELVRTPMWTYNALQTALHHVGEIPTGIEVPTGMVQVRVFKDAGLLYRQDMWCPAPNGNVHTGSLYLHLTQALGLSDTWADTCQQEPLWSDLVPPTPALADVDAEAPPLNLHGGGTCRVILPDALKSHVRPTAGQVVTFAFMRNRESHPYADRLGHILPGGYLLTPYLRQPLVHYQGNQPRLGGGLLASETGTGKTLSTLLLAMHSGHTLAVVPDTLVSHWASEVRKHSTWTMWERTQEHPLKRCRVTRLQAHSYDVIVLHRTADARALNWDPQQMPRLVIAAHCTVRSGVLAKQNYTRLILDEAHHLTHRLLEALQMIYRKNTWAITATPYNQTNRLMEVLGLDTMARHLGLFHHVRLRYFLYRECTLRTALNQTNMEVVVKKVYCPQGTDEQAFFAEIYDIMDVAINSLGDGCQQFNRCSHRFFRILERLGAGGMVNRSLILQVLRRVFYREVEIRGSPAAQLRIDHRQPPQRAFTDPQQDCAICMVPFIEPVQLPCGHVYCRICVDSLVDMQMHNCPICRQWFDMVFDTPYWQATEPAVGTRRPATDEVQQYHQVFQTIDHQSANALYLQGKHMGFQTELQAWVQRRAPQDQLVIYCKENGPAAAFHTTLMAQGLRITCAGLMGVTKRPSVENIERFRQGDADILFISNHYAAGFDLFMASELWLLNTDLATWRMEQCQGRVLRVAQCHPQVVIRVFLYQHGFDEFLWDLRDQLKSQSRYDRRHLQLFHLYNRRTVLGSAACQLWSKLQEQYPDLKPQDVQAVPGKPQQLSVRQSIYDTVWQLWL